MALNLETKYGARANASSADYPYGSVKDKVGGVADTGTPIEADIMNDFIGLGQKLLDEASIIPSNAPDNVTSSQYYNAMTTIFPAKTELAAADSSVLVGGVEAGEITQRLSDAEQRIVDLPAEVDAAGTAANLVAEHNGDAASHPALSAFITAEADRAEAAAEAASATGRIYETSAAGQADVGLVEDDYFWVVSTSDINVLELWRKGESSPTDTNRRMAGSNFVSTEIAKPYSVDVTGVIDDEFLISALSGDRTANANYRATGYIPVNGLKPFHYTGETIGDVGLAYYDDNKTFISGISKLFAGVYVPPINAAYVRASTDIRITSNLSIKIEQDTLDAINVINEIASIDVDLVDESEFTDRYIAADGSTVASSSYRMTPFIPITDKTSLVYTGRFANPGNGIAVYDIDYNFLEIILGVGVSDAGGPNFVSRLVFIDNPNAAFIRSCSSTLSPTPFSLITKKYNKGVDAAQPNIMVIPDSTTSFSVGQLTSAGYIYHLFVYRDDELRAETGWYSTWVQHNGAYIAQGNFNFIHNINLPNENTFVGMGHGCEIFRWVQFFVDGKPFYPSSDTQPLVGDKFHFQFVSDIYAADQSKETGDRTQPQTPLVQGSVHYMDCEITREGVKRYNKLIVKRDGIQFSQLFGAMQQTSQPAINGNITINAAVPYRVHFPDDPAVAEPLAPDTLSVGGDFVIPFADKVIAEGVREGYVYSIETQMRNADTSKNGNQSIRAWFNRASSNKFYFNPVVTTATAGAVGISAQTFNDGDVIECISSTKYNISKIE